MPAPAASPMSAEDLAKAAYGRGYAQAVADALEHRNETKRRIEALERERTGTVAGVGALRQEVAGLASKIETETRAYAAAAAAPAAPVNVTVTSEALQALVREEIAAWARANPPAPVSVVVNVPEAPPVVVPAPQVTIEKPDPVVVHVEVPEQKAPSVTLEQPKVTVRRIKVLARDAEGRVSEAESRET